MGGIAESPEKPSILYAPLAQLARAHDFGEYLVKKLGAEPKFSTIIMGPTVRVRQGAPVNRSDGRVT